MKTYLGIDPSSKCTGVCIIREDGTVLAAEAIMPLGSKAPLICRINDILRGFEDFLARNGKHLATCHGVAIEKPFSGALWMVHGCLATSAWNFTGVMPKPILVQSVKKFAGAPNKDDDNKTGLRKAVKKEFAFEHASHDVVDAFVLACIANSFDNADLYPRLVNKARVY